MRVGLEGHRKFYLRRHSIPTPSSRSESLYRLYYPCRLITLATQQIFTAKSLIIILCVKSFPPFSLFNFFISDVFGR